MDDGGCKMDDGISAVISGSPKEVSRRLKKIYAEH
jgi:hypothetical protein